MTRSAVPFPDRVRGERWYFSLPRRKVPKRRGIRGSSPLCIPLGTLVPASIDRRVESLSCRIVDRPAFPPDLALEIPGMSFQGAPGRAVPGKPGYGAVGTPPPTDGDEPPNGPTNSGRSGQLGPRAGLGSAPTDQDKTPHGSASPGKSCYPGKRAADSRPYGGERKSGGIQRALTHLGHPASGRVWNPPLRTETKPGAVFINPGKSRLPGKQAATGRPYGVTGTTCQIGTHPASPLRA